jgi:hypothetical protein
MQQAILLNLVCWSLRWVNSNSQARQNKIIYPWMWTKNDWRGWWYSYSHTTFIVLPTCTYVLSAEYLFCHFNEQKDESSDHRVNIIINEQSIHKCMSSLHCIQYTCKSRHNEINEEKHKLVHTINRSLDWESNPRPLALATPPALREQNRRLNDQGRT